MGIGTQWRPSESLPPWVRSGGNDTGAAVSSICVMEGGEGGEDCK